MRTLAAVLLLLALTGCKRGRTYAEVAWGEPEPPRIDWLAEGEPPIAPPALTPCPEGWEQVDAGDGITACDPYPLGSFETCADGAHFPGEPACRAVGRTCRDGDPFPDVSGLPGGPILHVLATASAGGDGSRERPFAKIGDALAAAPPGAIVAVGEGRYDEGPSVRRSVTIVGACPARTVIDPTVAGEGAILVRDGAALTIESISFEGRRGGIAALGDATVDARGIVVSIEAGSALWLEGRGVRAHVEDLVVHDAADAARQLPGAVILRGASLDVARAAFVDIAGDAIEISDAGSTVVASEILVARAERPAVSAAALRATDGASATLRRAWIGDTVGASIVAGNADVEAEDVVIRGVRGQPIGGYGFGPLVANGGSLVLRRVIVDGAVGFGVGSEGVGNTLEAEDLVVRDVGADVVGARDGAGIAITGEGVASLERVLVIRVRDAGLLGVDGARVELRDARISTVDEGLPAEQGGYLGHGVHCGGGSVCTIARTVIEGATDEGLRLIDQSTEGALEDVVIRDVRPGSQARGRGFAITHAAHATGSRILVDGAYGLGFFLESLMYRDEEEGVSDARFAAEDVVVRRVLAPACATTTCPDLAELLSVGAMTSWGGDLTLRRFVIEDTTQGGFWLQDGRARLEDGLIRRTRVAIAVFPGMTIESQDMKVEDVELDRGWQPGDQP